tara:strand:- start:10877 stop:11299 length:423 start_codon:yes stop_codon:yes gene_type:complete
MTQSLNSGPPALLYYFDTSAATFVPVDDGSNKLPVDGSLSVAPPDYTLVPLDVAVVTTGGAAVTALDAGNRTGGGWIQNPVGAPGPLGVNEIGTASGTTSSGNTTFIAAGQTYTIAPSAGAVSVISASSSHVFSGVGFTV